MARNGEAGVGAGGPGPQRPSDTADRTRPPQRTNRWTQTKRFLTCHRTTASEDGQGVDGGRP